MQLLCPKCHNVMTRYERNGVSVDQCAGCGGLFLDRGELEHLVQAEAAYYATPGAAVPPRPEPIRGDRDDRRSDDPRSDDRRYDERRFSDEREYKAYKRKKKARSFLDDLLDF